MYIQIDDLTCLFGADEDSVAEEIKQSEPERAAQAFNRARQADKARRIAAKSAAKA